MPPGSGHRALGGLLGATGQYKRGATIQSSLNQRQGPGLTAGHP
jgi:hypothetical protein